MPFDSDVVMTDEDQFEKIRIEGIKVEPPQVLRDGDIMKKPRIYRYKSTIPILSNIIGMKILPVNIVSIISQI